jgi:hypothetical protein
VLEILANRVLEELAEEDGNLPAAIVSAAYGYSRGGNFSPLAAIAFGIAAYKYPVLSSVIVAADATLFQDTPARRFAAEQGRELLERRAAKVKRLGL